MFIFNSLGRLLGQVAQEEFVVGRGSQGTGDSHLQGKCLLALHTGQTRLLSDQDFHPNRVSLLLALPHPFWLLNETMYGSSFNAY